MAQTVRYPYHGTLNGGTGHKRTQPGALSYILGGGMGDFGCVVGSTLTGIPGARTLTGPQEQQRYRAIGAYRARQAQIASFSGAAGGDAMAPVLTLDAGAPPLQVPPIGALNVYSNQILAHVQTLPFGQRQGALERYALALLRHAASLADRPNWAESYLEAAYPLADAYIEAGKEVAYRMGAKQVPAGLTRDGVLKRWRGLLDVGAMKALAVAVPQTFRNTATPAGTTDPRAVPAAPAPPGGTAKGVGGLGLFALLAAGAAYMATR